MTNIPQIIHSNDILLNLGGFFWLLTYLFAIYISYKDKVIAIPCFAVAVNFAWEILFLLTVPQTNLFYCFDMIACILDLIIFIFTYRYLINERNYKNHIMTMKYGFLSLWLGSFFLIYFFENETHSYLMRLSGYIDNLIMSYLFCGMYWRRGSLLGQSSLLALCKLLGTFFITLWNSHVTPFSWFILTTGSCVFVLDLYYFIVLVSHKTNSYENTSYFQENNGILSHEAGK
jgi:hypothetical protein